MTTSTARATSESGRVEVDYDVIGVGAGFAGMYLVQSMRENGFSVHVFEALDEVGGTWYANRYPGCRCDVQSMEYSYSFDDELQQDWRWTEKFAPAGEILEYAKHVADRYDLKRDITFDTRVVAAVYDEAGNYWTVTTDKGHQFTSRFVVMTVGSLSEALLPQFPGIEKFSGQLIHTGAWPQGGVDLEGKRVAVIGTGSSGVQLIPEVAERAGHLTVLQRTPAYVLPARNVELSDEFVTDFRSRYGELRDKARNSRAGTLKFPSDDLGADVPEHERQRRMEEAWAIGGTELMQTFKDIGVNQETNDIVADFVKSKIRAAVSDRATADLLTSMTYPIGAKRIILGTDYYETYNRDNVELVDVSADPITAFTETGIETRNAHHEFDVVIFATGFDAVTGPISKIDVRGVGGAALVDEWAGGPRVYLGLGSHGFPNLFFSTGPGSPGVLANMVVAIEQHIDWITRTLTDMRERNQTRIEASETAQDEWIQQVADIANQTLAIKADSWYLGANVPGKPRVFMFYMGGFSTYRATCEKIRENGYEGFVIR